MIKNIFSILILISLTSIALLVFYVDKTMPTYNKPVTLIKAENTKGYMLQSKRMWSVPENGIKSVVVVRDEPDFLEVKVEYLYSGEQGNEVSTCGGIHKDLESYNDKWGCRPTRLKKGDHSVILRFGLVDERSSNKECSQAVALSFYKHGGSDFYKDYFIYKKAWLKGESNLLGRLKQLFHLKMNCT